MSTTRAPSAAEYERLTREQTQLTRALREQGVNSAATAKLHAVTLRLREIRATPPAGYTLPKAAADLVAHAEAHGWLTLVQWDPEPGYEGDCETFVTVQVGRRVVASDGYVGPGDRWVYKLTWHSRDCLPGRLRRFGAGHAVTPDCPAGGCAPSVRGISAVISTHPGAVASRLAAQ